MPLGRPHAIQLGHRPARASAAPARDAACAAPTVFQIFDISLQDAHIALGQTGRRAPPLLQLLLAGGRPRLDQHVSHAQLLDEPQRLLLARPSRSPASRSPSPRRTRCPARSAGCAFSARADWRAPAGCRRRPSFRQRLHGSAGPAGGLFCWSGLDIATSSPSPMPVITAWLSLRRTSVTSWVTKPLGVSR